MVEFTVTVQSTYYGNVYYINGVEKPIIPVVTGGTFRFNQNAATNNGHPLVLSTTTSTAGIISSGVSYYLDGASNQANYTNTSLFNAATVRYIEITVAQTADFYYLCYVHGIGMGNSMDVTSTTWGALGWNIGEWAEQGDGTAILTGNNLTLSIGSVTVALGQQVNVTTAGLLQTLVGDLDPSPDVSVTGQQLTLSLNSIIIQGDVIANLTGQQLTLSLNSVEADAITIVNPTTQLLNLTLGNVDPSPDVVLTGLQMNLFLNNIEVDSTVVTGQQLTLSLNSVTTIGDGNVNITGLQLTTSLNSPTFITNAFVNLTGNALTMSLNSVNNQIWTIVNTGTSVIFTEINTAA